MGFNGLRFGFRGPFSGAILARKKGTPNPKFELPAEAVLGKSEALHTASALSRVQACSI